MFSGVETHPQICLLCQDWSPYDRIGTFDDPLSQQFRDLFICYCQSLDPSYSAIMTEQWLRSPEDVSEKDDTFHEFYLSRCQFGDRLLAEVQAMFNDVETLLTPTGLFVFACNGWSNHPGALSFNEAARRSGRVGGILRTFFDARQ